MTERETFGFVGCGRVGRTLAQAFANAGRAVTAAWSRRAADAETMVGEVPGLRALPSAQAVADACDVIWITVSDDAIAAVSDGIAWSARHKVVHCSGATEVLALSAAHEAGAAIGGFHPLQMFANPAVALKGLPGCTVGIEADAGLRETLNRLALDIGCTPVEVPAGERALYHASAYYVGPFLIALLAEAIALWRKFGVGERGALNALLPLLSGTLSAVQDGGLAQGMGGCVARGDVGTVRKHVAAMDQLDSEAGELYRMLASRTIPLGLKRGTLNAKGAKAIREALGPGNKIQA